MGRRDDKRKTDDHRVIGRVVDGILYAEPADPVDDADHWRAMYDEECEWHQRTRDRLDKLKTAAFWGWIISGLVIASGAGK